MSIVVLVPSGEVKEIPFDMLNNLIKRDFFIDKKSNKDINKDSLNIKWENIYNIPNVPYKNKNIDKEPLNIKWETTYSVFTIPDRKTYILKELINID